AGGGVRHRPGTGQPPGSPLAGPALPLHPAGAGQRRAPGGAGRGGLWGGAAMSTRRLAALLLTLAPHLGHAACGLASTGAALGVYDVFSNSHTDSTGTITVSCDLATPYTLSLSPGSGSGSYGQRTLLAGP